MKAAGKRSKNKRCIKKNLSGEKKEPCAGSRHEIIYNKVIPYCLLFLRFMYFIDMKIKYT